MILVFAFVAGASHAPASAHADSADHHVEHTQQSAHDALLDFHDEAAPEQDGAADTVHHHHCPTTLDGPLNSFALAAITGKALLPSYKPANLNSFSQAPPTQPPSA